MSRHLFIALASIEPRRVVVMTSHENLTHEVTDRTRKLAINFIPGDRVDWLAHWGYQSGRTVDKFADFPWQAGSNGCPVLEEAPGHIEGDVVASMDAGDHDIRLVAPTFARIIRPLRRRYFPWSTY